MCTIGKTSRWCWDSNDLATSWETVCFGGVKGNANYEQIQSIHYELTKW